MVRIVNGVVVDDDDPRAQQGRDRRQQQQRGGTGGIHQPQHQDEPPRGHPGMMGGRQQAAEHHVSPLATANEKLLSLGIPRMQIAGYTLEPIVSVGFLLAFMLMGFPGLLFGAVLFYLHQSQQQPHRQNPANR